MKDIGLTRSNFDHAVFYCKNPFIIIYVHVDDMTLLTKIEAVMTELKRRITAKIEVKDGGKIHWMLGIEIQQSLGTITLSQKAYIRAIIMRYGFENHKPLSIPMDPSVKLDAQVPNTREEIIYMENKPYAEALGALQYLSVAT